MRALKSLAAAALAAAALALPPAPALAASGAVAASFEDIAYMPGRTFTAYANLRGPDRKALFGAGLAPLTELGFFYALGRGVEGAFGGDEGFDPGLVDAFAWVLMRPEAPVAAEGDWSRENMFFAYLLTQEGYERLVKGRIQDFPKLAGVGDWAVFRGDIAEGSILSPEGYVAVRGRMVVAAHARELLARVAAIRPAAGGTPKPPPFLDLGILKEGFASFTDLQKLCLRAFACSFDDARGLRLTFDFKDAAHREAALRSFGDALAGEEDAFRRDEPAAAELRAALEPLSIPEEFFLRLATWKATVEGEGATALSLRCSVPPPGR